jgi:hypothetical protein
MKIRLRSTQSNWPQSLWRRMPIERERSERGAARNPIPFRASHQPIVERHHRRRYSAARWLLEKEAVKTQCASLLDFQVVYRWIDVTSSGKPHRNGSSEWFTYAGKASRARASE